MVKKIRLTEEEEVVEMLKRGIKKTAVSIHLQIAGVLRATFQEGH